MNIEVAASTKMGYVVEKFELDQFGGSSAGVCYMPLDFKALKNEDIEKDMKRTLTLNFSYDATKGKYIVEGKFLYELTTLIPSGASAYTRSYEDTFYQQEFDALENVYLFFTPNLEVKMDDIEINNYLTGKAADLNVYLVEQINDELVAKGVYENLMNQYWLTVALFESQPPLDPASNKYIYHTKIRTNLGSTISSDFDGKSRILYSGVNASQLDQKVLIDQEKDKTRIYNISIDLYHQPETGTAMFKEDDYIISFTSSKGE